MTQGVTSLDDNSNMKNNTTTKGNTVKKFNVIAIDPTNNQQTTFESVHADQLFQNEDGETRFRYNHHHNNVEVITATEIPQSKIDADAAYFAQHGTASE